MKASAVALTMFAAGAIAAAADAPATELEGRWRITHGIVAPWVAEEAQQPDAAHLVGQTVEFAADEVRGPGVLACANARYETSKQPLANLFQGNLPEPVENGAGEVGLTKPPIETISLACDTGLFDLHVATADAVLLGLDNVVWVLDRSPGALAADDSPEHALQRFLEDHYRNGLEFTPERSTAQRGMMSNRLSQAIAKYFAQDFPEGDVPPIDGDPYTDSQEYPPIFSVRDASIDGGKARVPVRFDNGYESREVRYQLIRERERWVIDDVDYDHGTQLREWLKAKPGD